MKKIAILGSTGSVGVNTLEVIRGLPEQFQVVALACGKNLSLLREQVKQFKPSLVSVEDIEDAKTLKRTFPNLEVMSGDEGLTAVATFPESDLLVSALVGAKGIRPTIEAIRAKKDIALANKEVLVSAGSLITSQARQYGVKLLPIDSEHSAIFQVLEENNYSAIEKITLTASGGPFLRRPIETFDSITSMDALKHPQWSMGKRITIDSATLLNKGFEVIEAHWLFNLPASQIDVVIHPQSIVHSLVSYRDGNTLACLSAPDMKAPISYALSHPNRFPTEVQRLNLVKVKELTFEEPPFDKFPLLRVAYECLKRGGFHPCILNAADEVVVDAFLKEKIKFTDIHPVIDKTLNNFKENLEFDLENLLAVDRWARTEAIKLLSDLSGVC